MSPRAKIVMAVGGSALCHFALIGGAVGWIALGGVPENDDFSLRTKLGVAKSIQVVGTQFRCLPAGG